MNKKDFNNIFNIQFKVEECFGKENLSKYEEVCVDMLDVKYIEEMR